ncbi:MAG: glutathione S-transferase family protein [Burkholderiales bacterium]|nr:glutathione S-transferase family protein [Burkholderiales bacterium]
MKLYTTKSSGNGYKVALLLSMLNRQYETVLVDFPGGEHKRESFTALNPRSQVPVLEDAGRVIWDSSACLAYLARKYGGEQWLPSEPGQMAEVLQWVALALNEIQFGLQYARGIVRGIRSGHYDECAALGRKGLDVLEGRLRGNDWLALGRPTIADIACYPYTARAPEGNVSLEPYPKVQAWLQRVEALPGYFKVG